MSQYCKTICQCYRFEHTEKKSRFIAYLFPCVNQADFQVKLDEINEEYPKARHFCYAWRFGEKGVDYRANDDGEPSGTAGLPIFNQLQSFDVSNVGLIVVRYFGGRLLGASGLIKAYKTAAQEVLLQADLTMIVPKMRLLVSLRYAQINQLMQIVEAEKLMIIEQSLAINCQYLIEINRDDYSKISGLFSVENFLFEVAKQ